MMCPIPAEARSGKRLELGTKSRSSTWRHPYCLQLEFRVELGLKPKWECGRPKWCLNPEVILLTSSMSSHCKGGAGGSPQCFSPRTPTAFMCSRLPQCRYAQPLGYSPYSDQHWPASLNTPRGITGHTILHPSHALFVNGSVYLPAVS